MSFWTCKAKKWLLIWLQMNILKSVDTEGLKGDLIQCQFLDWKEDSYKSVMTWAKLARGMMAREIIKNQVDKKDQLKEITFDGYGYNDQLSAPSNLVFTRDKR